MYNLYCEHPVIIRHPRLKDVLPVFGSYKTPNGLTELTPSQCHTWKYRFPEWLFSASKCGVTLDNIDDFQVINQRTGEVSPMFMAVPCGKCILCRDKKKREWSFRATCENVFSTSIPIFVTLTYNDKHLPKHGVFKEEVQLFMKRLRIRLDRLGYKHQIRYFFCSEYGSKSGRPHYHAIFWNFPRDGALANIWNVVNFIEKAWSYNNEPLGYCYAVPCDKGAIGYVMKYMSKIPKIPANMNQVFFLSSRKDGGIGAAYARRLMPFYRANPQCLDITVCDPYSGMSTTVLLPEYFKRLYYPANSSVLSKEVRDAHKKLCDCISERYTLHCIGNYTDKLRFSDIEKKVLRKYSFLNPKICKYPIGKKMDYYSQMPWQALDDRYVANECEIASLCRFLMLESIDETWFEIRDEILQKRQRALDVKFSNMQPININDVKYRKLNALKLAELGEKL